ncbi:MULTISPECIES: LPS export ABC transporter periplasmic protein LptC [Flavobacterium]|uniref:LPS export ABC transporter periplasmic protein LptC n=1 Tax=Flavobacterium ginsengisoli TaxID=871694 RepID=A0ABP7EWB4_9FLAO|nr:MULTISPECIES: LPS export ABC transporter periplasmic protein LptC [Flavobacterium]MBJ2123136.1 LPS export ABC transporter periplasmic protein LptC [Flavobacterium sp. IB48]
MNLPKRYSLIVVTVIAVTMFFGCESNFKEVQKINFSEFVPASDADTVNIKYTDSGRITGVLISPKMLDYSNLDFPFTEFPKGIDVTLYDKRQKRTFIKGNYAVSYKNTGIIDLIGKVKITSEAGQILETEQLYFDQKNEWFYTERKFKLTDKKGVSHGQGIDFSKDFKVINSQRVTGEIESNEEL